MVLALRSVIDLQQLSICTVVDHIERFMRPYYERWNEITEKKRPIFGPFGHLVSAFLIPIINELLKREETTYKRLRVLLPEDAENLTCDENKRFSPFGCPDTIELISKRCDKFNMLHCHIDVSSGRNCVILTNLVFEDSIQRLEHLREINFYDTWISNLVMNSIALHCPKLTELNLHHTNLCDNDVNSLLAEQSVIKDSLTKLIIDETLVSTQSVERCLLSFPNLTHFQSDSTIDAALQLFERSRGSAKATDTVPNFKTTICKNRFHLTNKSLLTEDFVNWLGEKFPRVNHLNISLEEGYKRFVGHLITSWNHITHLELSSLGKVDLVPFLEPAIVSCQNLVTLKLEKFLHVDITSLGNGLKKLENLILINNTFRETDGVQFENLKELQIILFQDTSNFDREFLRVNSDSLPIRHTDLLFLLASKNIEKLLIYDQSSFLSSLMNNLLEGGYLRNLKELKVFKCPLEIESIWKLFRLGISVNDIVVGFCDKISDEDVQQLFTYCKENNLATSIKMALKNPYYLRWLVQEGEVPYYISNTATSF